MSSRIVDHPVNTDLLYLHTNHRAYGVFREPEENKQMDVRRCDRRFFQHIMNEGIPDPVMTYIRAAGFGGVIDAGYRKVDHALITALIERWRPETHTFHLPIGEVTVTLQDVQVMWGLPIEGNIVSGIDTDFVAQNSISTLCEDMMGFTPNAAAIKGAKIKLSYLLERLSDPLDDNEDSYRKRARIYIMCLLGGTIFPDSSFTSVFLLYLQNLTDLSYEGQLSWGSAVIASLYRNLCKAVEPSATYTQGPMLLLQLWAWERIGAFAPTIVGNQYHFETAYGARYGYKKYNFIYCKVYLQFVFIISTLFIDYIHKVKNGNEIWHKSNWE